MSKMNIFRINDAVNLNVLTEERFKTIRISVNMLLPLQESTAAVYGILPRIVTRATKEYPDYTAFCRKQADLYGAAVDCEVSKIGGYQILSLYAEGISSQYAFDGEDMVQELSDLLFSILLTPLKDEAGLFPLDGFEQEKRQILEMFDSEYNDKAQYAYKRAIELLFGERPEGINHYGTKACVEALTREMLATAWEELLQQAKYEIFILGDCNPDIEAFQKIFAPLGKNHTYRAGNIPVQHINTVTEEMSLAQSKLVLGFIADTDVGSHADFKLMSALYGGTPSSKLFLNVREKMGLCYYCSSLFDSNTHIMLVQSGVETENVEKAQQAILQQLAELQSGHITEEEIESAKLSIQNAYRSINDYLGAIESWYLSQSFRGCVKTPEEAAEEIMAVTKEEIVAAANRLSLHTVYILKGNA